MWQPCRIQHRATISATRSENRMLLRKKKARLAEVDKSAFILDQLCLGGDSIRRRHSSVQVCLTFPPDLRDAIIWLLQTPALQHQRVKRRHDRVALYVATSTNSCRNGLYQWAMLFKPVPIKRLAIDISSFSDAVDKFDHAHRLPHKRYFAVPNEAKTPAA